MTTVAFFRGKDGKLIGYEASGHSGYAASGADIVCAAVSALTEATLNGLHSVIGAPLTFDRDEQNARLTACLTDDCPNEALEKAQILLRTLQEAVQAVAREYPRNVRIIFKERRKYACSE